MCALEECLTLDFIIQGELLRGTAFPYTSRAACNRPPVMTGGRTTADGALCANKATGVRCVCALCPWPSALLPPQRVCPHASRTGHAMAASQPWFGWLSGLLSGMWPKPAPDTHGAWLEEVRASALLDKELRKPRALRDDELVRELRVDYGTHQLRNLQVRPAGASVRGGGGGPVEAAEAAASQHPVAHRISQLVPELCLQARVSNLAFSARSFEEPIARECCAAAAWVWLRMAASMRAQHDYYCQRIEQVGSCSGGVQAGAARHFCLASRRSHPF